MLVLACAVGFIGPFGTYVRDRLADRVVTWWLLLMGAYLLVRPAIFALRRVAAATELSATTVVFWACRCAAFPLLRCGVRLGGTRFATSTALPSCSHTHCSARWPFWRLPDGPRASMDACDFVPRRAICQATAATQPGAIAPLVTLEPDDPRPAPAPAGPPLLSDCRLASPGRSSPCRAKIITCAYMDRRKACCY